MTPKADKQILGMTYSQWRTAFLVFTLLSSAGVLGWANDLFGVRFGGNRAYSANEGEPDWHKPWSAKIEEHDRDIVKVGTRQDMIIDMIKEQREMMREQDRKADRILRAVRENR